MKHTPEKLNLLRCAIHDLADEYDAQKNHDFADTLREVSNDPAMLSKFADLLVHYDTPGAAVEAMQREAAKRIDGSLAAADLSGRHTPVRSIQTRDVRDPDAPNGVRVEPVAPVIGHRPPGLKLPRFVETNRGEFMDMRSSDD